MDEYAQQWMTVEAVRNANLHVEDVWLIYVGAGGHSDEFEIRGYLCGLTGLPRLQRYLITYAVNELLEQRGMGGIHPLLDVDSVTNSAAGGREGLMDTDEPELRRCCALYESGLLDIGSEERFDRITRRARERFRVGSASIALITEERQVIKSVAGPIGEDLPREHALCAVTVREDRTLVIQDAGHDPRFRNHPWVTGGPRLRFYAGHPISTADGWRIASLCVVDQQPRQFTEEDARDLRNLAGEVQLEMWLGPDD